MDTRIQLTPTGRARGQVLVVGTGGRDPAPAYVAAALAVTPQPPAAANAPATAPVPAAAAAAPNPPELYGIRGVVVFYFSHESAIAGAASLGLVDPKILVSRNAAKSSTRLNLLGTRYGQGKGQRFWLQRGAQKKRGQESDFKGQHLKFLTEKIPDYIAASKPRGKKEAKTEGLPVFWAGFFAEYWTRFPWDLPLDKEPNPNVNPPVLVTADDLFTALGLNLSKEEQDRKSQIQKETKAHPDFREGVQARFLAEHGDEPKDKHIILRCEIAKEMFLAEDTDVQTQIREEYEVAHTRELEEYKNGGEGVPNPDPDIQQQCCDNFLTVVQPLLTLQAYTGLTLNIIGGRINKATKEFETIRRRQWQRLGSLGPEGYASTLKLFLKFVHTRYLEYNNLIDEGPGGGVPPAPVIDSSAFEALSLLRIEPTDGVDVDMPPASNDSDGVLAPLPEEDNVDRALGSGALLAGSPSAPPPPSVPRTAPSAPPASSAPPAPSAPPTKSGPPTPSTPPAPSGLPAPSAPPAPSVPLAPSASASAPAAKPMWGAWGLAYLGDDLQKELLAMDAEPWEEYLRRLRRMTPSMQEGESNLVRNRALADKGRKQKKPRVDEEDLDDKDDDESSSDSGEEGGGEAVERTPVKTRGKGCATKDPTATTASTMTATTTVTKAPKWVLNGRKVLLEREEMGTDWRSIVDLWWGLEEQSGFATLTKSHPTMKRPKAVAAWVKNAQKSAPDIRSTKAMEAQWWAWWKAVNPGWRLCENELVQLGDGDWDGMCCDVPAKTGWKCVIADVKWTLTRMVGVRKKELISSLDFNSRKQLRDPEFGMVPFTILRRCVRGGNLKPQVAGFLVKHRICRAAYKKNVQGPRSTSTNIMLGVLIWSQQLINIIPSSNGPVGNNEASDGREVSEGGQAWRYCRANATPRRDEVTLMDGRPAAEGRTDDATRAPAKPPASTAPAEAVPTKEPAPANPAPAPAEPPTLAEPATRAEAPAPAEPAARAEASIPAEPTACAEGPALAEPAKCTPANPATWRRPRPIPLYWGRSAADPSADGT
ncbi:hypothetical protein K438DRAFT_1774900 [Mycena galopus ATCC 62051]|nr:hypothetical protein K438DRAFT_1774900 [Mycena galopus ATCC 62051]